MLGLVPLGGELEPSLHQIDVAGYPSDRKVTLGQRRGAREQHRQPLVVIVVAPALPLLSATPVNLPPVPVLPGLDRVGSRSRAARSTPRTTLSTLVLDPSQRSEVGFVAAHLVSKRYDVTRFEQRLVNA